MKKITSVIAIVLLAALLFTGCDFIPMKQDFANYGFTFTIAGKVEEKEENEFGNAAVQCLGKLFGSVFKINTAATEA